MGRHRVYSIELKRQAVSEVLSGRDLPTVAAAKGIAAKRLYDWVVTAQRYGVEALRAKGRPRKEEAVLRGRSGDVLKAEGPARQDRLVELERKVAQQELDLDFFRQALRHVKARQQEATGRGGLRSTRSSKR